MTKVIRSVPGRWLLNRRSVLRGAAGGAISLPFLSAMIPSGARAQAMTSPKRFIAWYVPGGTVTENWLPKGTETAFTLGPILSPLAPYQKDLIVINGLDLTVVNASYGHPHYRGIAAFLTGHKLVPGPFAVSCGAGGEATGWAQGPSLDQVIGAKIGGTTKLRTLEVAVRHDGPVGANPDKTMVYAAADKPIQPRVDPLELFNQLFGVRTAAASTRATSILDGVTQEFKAMAPRLGMADRQKIEAHLSFVEEVQVGINKVTTNGGCATCTAPAAPAATVFSSANVPQIGRALMDLAVLALACDLTRVLTFQWLEPLAFYTLPFLGLNQAHHTYQHLVTTKNQGGGYAPVELTAIGTWFMQQFAYFLGRLSAIQDCTGTLLDNSVIYQGSEIRHPPEHLQDRIPFLLAGNLGGTFRTGRFLSLPTSRSHIDLLVALQNAFGITSNTFGLAGYTAGALPGLT
jgi:hypothetical protein